jgi:lipopolysaccharide/colanic/teichoic acid biosynthesis glycosyltransferase
MMPGERLEPDGVAAVTVASGGTPWYPAAKRAIDVVGSSIGLILLLPLFVVMGLAIWLQDGGSIIHRREVIGCGGRRFHALKFRTMIVDADAYLLRHPELLHEYTQNVKLVRDPRVTPLGRALRQTSLDELPQLWNVLRGEMSLVGPRMIHPSEESRYGAFAQVRHTVRPGMTGLWQISRRRHESYEERIVIDMHYLAQRSLRTDLTILLQTFVVVLFNRVGQV